MENLNINNQSTNTGDVVLIVENVGKDLTIKSNEPKNIILEGTCAVFGKKNNNNRVYEKDEYLPHLSYLKEKIEKRALTGDLDHPPHFDVNLKSASHIIEDLSYNGGNEVKIKLRILEGTPNGQIAKALLNGGVNLSISSRAAGQVLNEGKVKLHKIFTYDLVGEPGFTEAILRKTVNESLKGDFKMITESYDCLKNNSYVEKNALTDISENLNFADNYKIYKMDEINNTIENVLENSIETENNNNNMSDKFVTVDSMENYSQVIKKQFAEIQEQLNSKKAISENAEGGSELESIKAFVNEMATSIEGLVKYTDYLSTMVDKSINYTEHIAETTNNSIAYSSYLSEKIQDNIEKQDNLSEKVDQTISYTEYIKENVNKSISYQNYLAEELDQSIQYSEYVAEGSNKAIEFSNYLSEAINDNRSYSEYVAEKAGQGIEYSEYLAESLNSTDANLQDRSLLGKVEKLDESASVDTLVNSVKEVIAEVTTDSAKSVLESRHPFLKTLSEENKEGFYKLDTETKQAIVEAIGASIWFNESDVMGIMEAVISTKNQNIPNHIKYMPAEYKSIWSNMNEGEKNRIHAKSQIYTLNTPYQVKSFWDEQNLVQVKERVEIEQNNLKVNEKLNESQGTEGMISLDTVVEHNRGYTSNYLDTLARRAQYRK